MMAFKLLSFSAGYFIIFSALSGPARTETFSQSMANIIGNVNLSFFGDDCENGLKHCLVNLGLAPNTTSVEAACGSLNSFLKCLYEVESCPLVGISDQLNTVIRSTVFTDEFSCDELYEPTDDPDFNPGSDKDASESMPDPQSPSEEDDDDHLGDIIIDTFSELELSDTESRVCRRELQICGQKTQAPYQESTEVDMCKAINALFKCGYKIPGCPLTSQSDKIIAKLESLFQSNNQTCDLYDPNQATLLSPSLGQLTMLVSASLLLVTARFSWL